MICLAEDIGLQTWIIDSWGTQGRTTLVDLILIIIEFGIICFGLHATSNQTIGILPDRLTILLKLTLVPGAHNLLLKKIQLLLHFCEVIIIQEKV